MFFLFKDAKVIKLPKLILASYICVESYVKESSVGLLIEI